MSFTNYPDPSKPLIQSSCSVCWWTSNGQSEERQMQMAKAHVRNRNSHKVTMLTYDIVQKGDPTTVEVNYG